jgi:hypothetical protein
MILSPVNQCEVLYMNFCLCGIGQHSLVCHKDQHKYIELNMLVYKNFNSFSVVRDILALWYGTMSPFIFTPALLEYPWLLFLYIPCLRFL